MRFTPHRLCLQPVLALFIALFLLALSACGQPAATAPTAAPAQGGAATTAVPVKRALANVVSAEALVVPEKRADLSFSGGGILAEVLVAEGETVVAGQELAKLDTRDRQQAVTHAEAALKAAQAQLAKAKPPARERRDRRGRGERGASLRPGPRRRRRRSRSPKGTWPPPRLRS